MAGSSKSNVQLTSLTTKGVDWIYRWSPAVADRRPRQHCAPAGQRQGRRATAMAMTGQRQRGDMAAVLTEGGGGSSCVWSVGWHLGWSVDKSVVPARSGTAQLMSTCKLLVGAALGWIWGPRTSQAAAPAHPRRPGSLPAPRQPQGPRNTRGICDTRSFWLDRVSLRPPPITWANAAVPEGCTMYSCGTPACRPPTSGGGGRAAPAHRAHRRGCQSIRQSRA